MGIEHFGNATVYTPDGVPALLQAATNPVTCCITSRSQDLFRCRRHWSEGGHTTEVCCCDPYCTSSRLDTFAAALRRISQNEWETVLLIMSEQGMHSLLLEISRKTGADEVQGALFKLQRFGDRPNGRVCITFESMLTTFPPPFDLGWAIQKKLGLSPSFFGIVEPEPSQKPVIVPADRNAKPRVALGTKPRGK